MISDGDQTTNVGLRTGVRPDWISEMLLACQDVLSVIRTERQELQRVCSERAVVHSGFEQRASALTARFAPRISALEQYQRSLQSSIDASVGTGPVLKYERDKAIKKARMSSRRPPIDVDLNGRIVGGGQLVADQAIKDLRASAAKVRASMVVGPIVKNSLRHALRSVNCVAFATWNRREVLQSEYAVVWNSLEEERQSARSLGDRAVGLAGVQLATSVDIAVQNLDRLLASGPPGARLSWTLEDWLDWTPSTGMDPICIGSLTAQPAVAQYEFQNAPSNVVTFADDIRRLGGIRYAFSNASRPRALSASRSLVARLLASVPPGKARFTFFDPLGLGESVAPFLALADYDPKLIDGKVWSSTTDLKARLADYTEHIETMIQKYLRGQYASIVDYNTDAGEIAEPYRFLFIHDFPAQFDQQACQQLSRIIENGPKCGVYPIVLLDTDAELPYGTSESCLDGLLKLEHHGPLSAFGQTPMTFSYDVDPIDTLGGSAGQELVDRIVDQVGRLGRGADNVTVDLNKALRLYEGTIEADVRPDLPAAASVARADDPASWWRNSSVDSLVAPIGQSGAKDVALLRLDSEILSGGLLVGRPGAGKSTLLHSYIGALCLLYSPTELEPYLIDFKEGVEFKAYAEAGLPHARCVAVESEREFGVSVLESIAEEMKRRAELIRSFGGEQTSFARVRGNLDEPLPRIVLVFDEFHVLFARDDKIGAKAAELLETIIRQGRGFGVHVLLGSQSLSGLVALGRHVLQLLPIRILLPSSETDAQLVLGDGNDAWRTLTRRGEGILNASAGTVEANAPFQAAYESEEDRLVRLKQLRTKADGQGFARHPVVFEGYGASEITVISPASFVAEFHELSPLVMPMRLATSMGLGGLIDVSLRRERAANVLVVGKNSHGVPLRTTLAAVASAASCSAQPEIKFVDFTSAEEGVKELLQPLLDSGLVDLVSRRASGRTIVELASEVARRLDEEDERARPILLVLFGLHRARDLDPNSAFDADPSDDLLTSVREILIDGPESGVHVLAWADSAGAVDRRLSRALRKEFASVVLGSMSRDDSQDLIGDDAAASLRSHQIAVLDDDDGTIRRGGSFTSPTREWLEELCSAAHIASD